MDIKEFKAELKDQSIEITPGMWQKITTVYNYHPAVVNPRAAIAMFFEVGGMTLINDMLPRAEELKKLENDIRSIYNNLKDLINHQAEPMQ